MAAVRKMGASVLRQITGYWALHRLNQLHTQNDVPLSKIAHAFEAAFHRRLSNDEAAWVHRIRVCAQIYLAPPANSKSLTMVPGMRKGRAPVERRK